MDSHRGDHVISGTTGRPQDLSGRTGAYTRSGAGRKAVKKHMPVSQIRKEWEAWMRRRRAGCTDDIVWSDDEDGTGTGERGLPESSQTVERVAGIPVETT